MNCTECGKNFIAELDFNVDGNNIIECPWCGHEHCRTIKKGVVTGERWDSRVQRVKVDKRSVWKSEKEPIVTSTAAAFLRNRWLNFGAD
jgi:hypothetical protein